MRQRPGCRSQRRHHECSDQCHCEECQLEARIENLLRIDDNEQYRDRGQYVQYPAFAIEKPSDAIERHTGGRAQHRRSGAADPRVKPCRKDGRRERDATRHAANPQQEQKHSREYRHVRSRNHQRMESARRTVILRP